MTCDLLTVAVCGNVATRTCNNLVYTTALDFPTNLPDNFGPGNQPFPPCIVDEPSCAVSGASLHLVATSTDHHPTGTFTICNTTVGPELPPISGTITEDCPNFDVYPTSYMLFEDQCMTVTATFHGDGQPGGVEACDILTGCGAVVVTGDDQVEAVETPAVFALGEAVPNPFNPRATIACSLPETQEVTLRVFNTSGQLVRTLARGVAERGEHVAVIDASNLSSGVYFYSLQAGSRSSLRKMVLMK